MKSVFFRQVALKTSVISNQSYRGTVLVYTTVPSGRPAISTAAFPAQPSAELLKSTYLKKKSRLAEGPNQLSVLVLSVCVCVCGVRTSITREGYSFPSVKNVFGCCKLK